MLLMHMVVQTSLLMCPHIYLSLIGGKVSNNLFTDEDDNIFINRLHNHKTVPQMFLFLIKKNHHGI